MVASVFLFRLKQKIVGMVEVLTDNGRQSTGVSVVDWVKEVQDRGGVKFC